MRKESYLLFTLVYLFSVLTVVFAESADTVYLNGKFYTANESQAWAEAVALKDGKFLHVGNNKSVKEHVGALTLVVDLEGQMAMPGIHDAHSHMLWGGLGALFDCRLPLGGAIDKLIAKLKDCAQGQAESDWIIAGSVWSEQLPAGKFNKALLDSAFPNTPVYIFEGSQHNAFVNSKALEVAGIDKLTAKPAGGRIIKDKKGELTGELVETAATLASKDFKAAPAWQRLKALKWASKLFSKFGITSTQESSGNATVLETFNWVDNDNQLNQSVAAHIIWGSPKFAFTSNETMEELVENRQLYTNRHIKVDFVKMWIDGSPTPPYYTDAGINLKTEEVDLSNVLIPVEKLNKYVEYLDKEGIKIKMHVAGAGAAHVALDAVAIARKANPKSKIIHELGHTGLLIPSDFPRMKKLNVIGDMSPTIWHLYGPTLGNPPLPAWQFRTLHENDVMMTMGTDWPVTDDPNMFPALQGLLDRGYESLDLETGLKMMTINGAISLGWQKDLGSIEAGKTANFIVLDRNLFDIPQKQIGETKVQKTVFEGRLVYENDSD